MRALAICLVLFSHTALFFPSKGRLAGPGLLAGYFGVELFFVLSGFLIGGILLRGFQADLSTASLRQFWIRRWFRTLPNYLLFLALNIALATWLGRNPSWLWSYFAFLQNLVTAPKSFFVESWSLAVEEWFYFLIPIALLAAIRSSRRPMRVVSFAVIATSILIVTIARTIYVVMVDPVWLTDVRMIVAFRLDACMFGVLGAWLQHYFPQFWNRISQPALATGLLLLTSMAAAPFGLSGDSIFIRTLGFSITSIGALLLMPFLAKWKPAVTPLSLSITKISLWSYSLYLANLPLSAVLKRLDGGAAPWQLATVFLVLSIAVAAFTFEIHERPMMNLRERWRIDSRGYARSRPACSAPSIRTAPG